MTASLHLCCTIPMHRVRDNQVPVARRREDAIWLVVWGNLPCTLDWLLAMVKHSRESCTPSHRHLMVLRVRPWLAPELPSLFALLIAVSLLHAMNLAAQHAFSDTINTTNLVSTEYVLCKLSSFTCIVVAPAAIDRAETVSTGASRFPGCPVRAIVCTALSPQ